MRKWITGKEAVALTGATVEQLEADVVAGDLAVRLYSRAGTTGWFQPGRTRFQRIDWATSTMFFPEGDSMRFHLNRLRLVDLYDVGKEVPPEPRKAGGRPPKWDWEAAAIDIFAIVYHGGEREPQRLADVERLLQNWFLDTAGEAPAESAVRKHAKLLLARLLKA